MANPDPDNGNSRDDLVKRLELMESMIAEGRQTVCRHGWIFVLWGLVNLVGWGLQSLRPHANWIWPVCLTAGGVITVIGIARRRDGRGKSASSRGVGAVWAAMGVTLALYVGAAIVTRFTWQFSYVSALAMIVGMAHATSATILRWNAQRIVAAIWWAGGVAIFFFNSRRATDTVFLAEMCFGMIAFGLYAMWLERRDGGSWVNPNA
jgi:hypothetical protein